MALNDNINRLADKRQLNVCGIELFIVVLL